MTPPRRRPRRLTRVRPYAQKPRQPEITLLSVAETAVTALARWVVRTR
ncbi:hypothetical protein KIK06_23760 [Nocardiopsis sp. EMB25]|nr:MULTISPECIES: hypothetical protein [Nocardiopsis]MCY9786904.1 hypothetical protein [Nocardiopsis sp. EMB25]